MLLSGEEIQKNLGGNIIIEPYHPSQLNPNSYNLLRSNELLVYDHRHPGHEGQQSRPAPNHPGQRPTAGDQ